MGIQQWIYMITTQLTTRLVLSMSAFLVLIVTTEECFEFFDWSFGQSSLSNNQVFEQFNVKNWYRSKTKELQSLGERITEFYNRTSRASVAYQNITDSCLSMPPNFMERSFEFVNAHFVMITADVNLAYMSYSENSTVGKFRQKQTKSIFRCYGLGCI